jgi:hypothetical protein
MKIKKCFETIAYKPNLGLKTKSYGWMFSSKYWIDLSEIFLELKKS